MHHDAKHAVEVLAENGRHFLRSTLREINQNSDAGNRNSVVFVAAAVEILLKTRLALEHWTLLLDDPSRAKLQDLASGDFVSAQASKLIPRLNNVVSLDLRPESANQVFRLRNRMVHFGPGSQIATKFEVALGLSFALDFIHSHLLPYLPPAEHEEFKMVKAEIAEVFSRLDAFKNDRLALLEGELMKHPIVLDCLDCRQKCLVVDDSGTASCLFCLSKIDSETLAQRYVTDLLPWSWKDLADGGDDPLANCPLCGSRTLVSDVKLARRPNITHVCFSCASAFKTEDLSHCTQCGTTISAGDASLCADCWRYMVED